jgi:hypothetical protein
MLPMMSSSHTRTPALRGNVVNDLAEKVSSSSIRLLSLLLIKRQRKSM